MKISPIVTIYVMKYEMYFEITQNIISIMRSQTRPNFIGVALKYQNHATFLFTLPQLPVLIPRRN